MKFFPRQKKKQTSLQKKQKMVCYSSDSYYYNNAFHTPYEAAIDDDLPALEPVSEDEVNPADEGEGEGGRSNNDNQVEDGGMFPFEHGDDDVLIQRYLIPSLLSLRSYTDLPPEDIENDFDERRLLYNVERRPMLLSRLLYENLNHMLGGSSNNNQEE